MKTKEEKKRTGINKRIKAKIRDRKEGKEKVSKNRGGKKKQSGDRSRYCRKSMSTIRIAGEESDV